MKKILLLACAALSMLPMFAQTNFRNISFDEAIQQAKAENKLVFIDFYTDWCGPCKKMAREVFPQKAVGDYFNANFVCIKLNAEKEGKPQADRFKVTAYPTFLVLDADQNVKLDIKGAYPADDFVAKIKNELNPELSPERMKQRYDSGERTPELVNAYAMSLMEAKKEQEGFQVVNDYFNSLAESERLSADNAFLFTRYTVSLNDPKADFYLNHLNDLEEPLKQTATAHANRLLRAELLSYVSGYRFENKQYNEADYQALKTRITSIGLDKEYPYAPLFDLVECYAKGDERAYFDLLKAKKSELAEQDFELILINTSRLFAADSPLLPEVTQYIRSMLPQLKGSSIMMMGRLLMNLEKTDE